MSIITITEAAQSYLADLLKKQNTPGIGVRIFITQPGTPSAETCLAYCKPDDQNPEDEVICYADFTAWIERGSIPSLEHAVVDYSTDRLGGQLTIKAPNAKLPMVSEDSPLEDKVNYYIQTEINPGLASHGGQVSLVDIDNGIAILRVGGGCQGCGQADLTLKEGIEKTLMERLPEIKGVRDVTDHSYTDNAYYR